MSEELVEEEWVVVFRGDLFNCRERQEELVAEEIEVEIVTMEGGIEGMPPVFELIVRREDIEDVADIFQEIWQDSLADEGLSEEEIKRLSEDAIDLSQDTIICPGCQTEISEITEEGECIECGLFLGFPDEGDDEESPED